jgi:SNF2 family DNA or RNA helicase
MGLGKTMSVLWSYDYLRANRQAKKMLVVCPLSTMERTWADEVFRSFPHLNYSVLYGTREKRQKLLKADADIYIINIDGVRTIEKELADRDDIDLICVDEVAMARNHGTQRWKTLDLICNKQQPRRVWALTGMPTPNAPTDAWAQCRLVVPGAPHLPRYFGKFRDMVMRQVTQFKWVPRPEANDVVKKCMQPAVRFALDDCIDLPEQIFIYRTVEMTPEQRAAYKSMLLRLKTEYDGGEILAVNEAIKAGKLVQISCGAAYDSSGETIVIPAAPRYDVLKEVIEESEGKVIVFVPLTGALEQVKKEIEPHWSCAVINGATPKNERDEIFNNFQKEDDPHVLIANPGTMSHGLTLTAATTVVWFAPIWNHEQYQQACARVRRPGQSRTTVIVHLAASEVEDKIYKRLQNKETMQGLLLDMMKGTSEES